MSANRSRTLACLPRLAAKTRATASGGRGIEDLDLQSLEEAQATLARFLQALIAKDEDTVASLVYAPSAARWGAEPGSVAATFREQWGVTDRQLAALGIVGTARILPRDPDETDELVAFGLVRGSGFGGPETLLTPMKAHALALIRDESGAWRIWGTPDPEDFADAAMIGLGLRGSSQP